VGRCVSHAEGDGSVAEVRASPGPAYSPLARMPPTRIVRRERLEPYRGSLAGSGPRLGPGGGAAGGPRDWTQRGHGRGESVRAAGPRADVALSRTQAETSLSRPDSEFQVGGYGPGQSPRQSSQTLPGWASRTQASQGRIVVSLRAGRTQSEAPGPDSSLSWPAHRDLSHAGRSGFQVGRKSGIR
jgi:hypothetical protein